MREATREFFASLAQQPPLPLRPTGIMRIDLADGERTEHWYLDIRRGRVTVSHHGPEPDCAVSTDLATFEAIVGGEVNGMAAVLRGLVEVEGQMTLLTALQRFFAGPTAARDLPAAGYARRQS